MYNFLFKKSLSSTNSFCKEQKEFVEDKTVVYCDFQTNGRGRFDRQWLSFDDKNICASVFLKINENNKKYLQNFTQYLSVILCRIFERYNIKPQIKWPNDILVNNKKIVGILAEGNFSNNEIKSIILGFGLNLNSTKEDLEKIDKPSTSVFVETQKTFDKKEFLEEIIKEFFIDYEQFTQKGFSFIENEYKQRCNFLGKEIKISSYKEKRKGIAEDITKDGYLIFITGNNKKEIISAGEIDF